MGILDYLDFSHLPVLNGQPGKAVPKGESRLQVKDRTDKQDARAEEKWKKAVRKRDGMHCRWCKRKVEICLDLVPERAECNHISGRVVLAIRWDVRNGLLLCCACHERITGKVNERFVIYSTKTFTVDGVSYINGDKPVKFKRVA